MTDFTELSAGEGHEARDLNVDIRSLWVVFKTHRAALERSQDQELGLIPGGFQCDEGKDREPETDQGVSDNTGEKPGEVVSRKPKEGRSNWLC